MQTFGDNGVTVVILSIENERIDTVGIMISPALTCSLGCGAGGGGVLLVGVVG